MPNWCSNTVMIQGSPEDVQEVLDTINVEGTAFNFNAIIKMPDALQGTSSPEKDPAKVEENIRLYGAKDWYDWANMHWGTKWNVDAKIVYDQPGVMLPGNRTVRIEFESAWAPPMPVYQVLAARFPNTNIYITYDESGAGFSGWAMYKEGKCVRENEYNESFYSRQMYMDPSVEIFDEFPTPEFYTKEVTDHVAVSKASFIEMTNRIRNKKFTVTTNEG